MLNIGDIVAIYIDNKPSVYARIEMIEQDIKPHWYQVRFLFLSFPVQETTWILRQEYLEGSQFIMKDIPIKIIPLGKPGKHTQSHPRKKKTSPGEVIPIDKIRRKKNMKSSDKKP